MKYWIDIPYELAVQHPKFGIKGFAAVFRCLLAIGPSWGLITAIANVLEIIIARGELIPIDYIVPLPAIICFLWSGWNVYLLGKHDSRFFNSFFTFLVAIPLLKMAVHLLWIMNTQLAVNLKAFLMSLLMQCIAWLLLSLPFAMYVILSKRINLTLRGRIRSIDPLVIHAAC